MKKSLLACLITVVALAAEPDVDRTRALVKQLGADTYKAREAAGVELLTFPRSALPVLREFENTSDPEIRERVRAVITGILADPSRVPQTIWTHRDSTAPTSVVTTRTNWNAAFIKWSQEGKISFCQTNGNSATGGSFAQSFVPHNRKLRAIAVQVYPISAASGWLSLDLRPDKDGRPDTSVLARSWLRMEKHCTPHSSFAVFQLPNTALELQKPCWFVLTEHPDPSESPHSMTNHRFDPKSDNPELQRLGRNRSPSGCANFFLLADCPPPPWLREAGETDRKNLPALPPSAFEW